MGRIDSFEKTLMLAKIEGRRRSGRQRMRWLDGITDSIHMDLGGLWELVMHREACRAVVHGITNSRTWLSNWTELNEVEVVVFLKFSLSLSFFFCFVYDPVDVGNLISGSSAFSKSIFYIWKFLVYLLLKPSLRDFEHYLASIWHSLAYLSL